MKLNIGSGLDYRDNWQNVDIDPDVKADWHGDATEMPYPDDTFDHIYSHHSLEHFPDLIEIVTEMVRVSKDGATWEIVVPYWSWSQNQGNPHHKIYFSEHTFDFFGEKYKRGHKEDWVLELTDYRYGWNEKVRSWHQYAEQSWMELKDKYLNVIKDITFKIVVRK